VAKKQYKLDDVARDIMHDVLVSVPSGTTVRATLQEMAEHDVDFAVVAKTGGAIVGIYTLSDEMGEIRHDEGGAFLDKLIDDEMNENLAVVAPTEKCVEVVRVLSDRRIHHVVVVERLIPIGVIGTKEINKWYIATHGGKGV
jgi:predicted transcriptional regulator